jgi:hypothetical protein
MMKIAGSGSASGSVFGSGSISQRHGSPVPDPHQNAMDPEHWPQGQPQEDRNPSSQGEGSWNFLFLKFARPGKYQDLSNEVKICS